MKARAYALAAVTLLGAMALSGCDSFSLPERFKLPGEGDVEEVADPEPLALAIDRDTAERLIGTVGLTPSGGVEPYEFVVSGYELYTGTNALSAGTVSGLIYSAGGAIGTIRITVSDSASSSASAYVTILPRAPIFTVADCKRTGSGVDVSLSWNYSDAFFDQHRLEFSVDDITYADVTGSDKKAKAYSENNQPVAETYHYRLYAISGSYESEPALISLARP